jgi:hypothetical protein
MHSAGAGINTQMKIGYIIFRNLPTRERCEWKLED